ncbi:hypothetical protein RRG08_038195 [Elysia crispata]|uniref:Uncharacterized protein n=1 Tax=Elysia crispata TaxID=231223 RepID=A0AAE1AMW1_9GAST|nr:hypothetical protein RRG08_038195 [Elysia crispata]
MFSSPQDTTSIFQDLVMAPEISGFRSDAGVQEINDHPCDTLSWNLLPIKPDGRDDPSGSHGEGHGVWSPPRIYRTLR